MKKTLSVLDKAEEFVMDGLIIIMFVTVLAQIVSRYVFNRPLLFTEEVSLLCFLWLTMLGTGYCFQHGLHTRITLFVDMLPKTAHGVLEIIINTGCAAGMIYFFYPALRFTITQSNVKSPVLPITMAVKYASFVAACVLVVLRTTEASLRIVKGLREGDEKK